jgi:hypothetical protein
MLVFKQLFTFFKRVVPLEAMEKVNRILIPKKKIEGNMYVD